MEKRNRIILLIDFSEYSENLTNFAFEISEIIKAKVIFVHQIPGNSPAMAAREVRDEVVRMETEEAHSNLRKLAKGRDYSSDSFQVGYKPLLSLLKELKNEYFFDWIVAGLKGTGALKRLFIGSTTLSLIDESDYLTLAIPARKAVTVPHKLLVGVSSKYPLNKIQFEIVLSSLKDQIRQLEFFTVLNDEEEEEEEEEEEAKAHDHLLELQTRYDVYKPKIQLYNGEDALNLLKNRVEFSENSFLVLQQGSRTLNDKLFRKFMINELVYSGQIPLIVLSK